MTEVTKPDEVMDRLRKLDGHAVANVNEPSPGDLARVLKENSRLIAELAATKAKLEEAEKKARVVLFADIIKNLTEMGVDETLDWIKSRGRFEIEKWEARSK